MNGMNEWNGVNEWNEGKIVRNGMMVMNDWNEWNTGVNGRNEPICCQPISLQPNGAQGPPQNPRKAAGDLARNLEEQTAEFHDLPWEARRVRRSVTNKSNHWTKRQLFGERAPG